VTLVLVNPTAGRGLGAEALAAAIPVLGAAEVVQTRDLEHARAVASAAAEEGGTVVVVGGDGIVGAVAGALRGTPARLGIVPAGRGNDFARALGIPLEPAAAARVVLGAGERVVDMARAGDRWFASIACTGFDAEVNRTANRIPWLRGAAYPASAVYRLARWRHADFRVTVDGVVHELPGFAVAVGVTGYYGAGMRAIPHAVPDDGELDVFLSGADARLRFLRDIPRRYDGGHVANPAVSFLRGREIRIEADRAFPVFADGEPVAALPIRVRVEPRCLRVAVPGSPGTV